MAKQSVLYVPKGYRDSGVVILPADLFIAANGGTAPTNTKQLLAAGADDSNIKSITISSDSTAAHIVQFWKSLDGGTTKHLLCAVNVPIGSGFLSGTTVNIDVLSSAVVLGFPLDMSGKPFLPIATGTTIWVGVTIAAVTASKTIYIHASVEDY